MITDELKAAFRWHMRNQRPAFYHAQGYKGRNAWPEKANGIALEAIARARADLIKGTRRYPAPVRQTYGTSESDGLRYVGRVSPEFRRGAFCNNTSEGWLTEPDGQSCRDGSGLCFGVVYQLPARKGESRFVAGCEFGGVDGGPDLDLKTIYTSQPGGTWGSAKDDDAARDAARHADSLAKVAAESEREYQTAWRAGSNWSQLGDEVESDRAKLLAILKERRALKGTNAPALCSAIRGTVKSLLRSIQSARAKRAELAAGDSADLYFWTGDGRLRAAFCEGANLDAFPC